VGTDAGGTKVPSGRGPSVSDKLAAFGQAGVMEAPEVVPGKPC